MQCYTPVLIQQILLRMEEDAVGKVLIVGVVVGAQSRSNRVLTTRWYDNDAKSSKFDVYHPLGRIVSVMGRVKHKKSEYFEVSVDIIQFQNDPNVLTLHSLQAQAQSLSSRISTIPNRRLRQESRKSALENKLECIVFNEPASEVVDIPMVEPYFLVALRCARFLVQRYTVEISFKELLQIPCIESCVDSVSMARKVVHILQEHGVFLRGSNA